MQRDISTPARDRRLISEEDAAWCVSRYKAGASCADLAKEAGISRQAMWQRLRIRTTMRPRLRHGAESHLYRGGSISDKRAHYAVERALISGRLVNPGLCEKCGGDGGKTRDGRRAMQAHHDDYNKTLEVRWLCRPCHREWHKHNTAVPRQDRQGAANGR